MNRGLPIVAMRAALVACSLIAFAACGGGGAASPTPVPTATLAPQSVATAVPVSINSSGGVSATPLPAPSGYSSNISIHNVSAPAGTTVQITSSTVLPSALPVLSKARSGAQSTVRIPQASSGYSAIFFDAITPSQSITVAGAVSYTQGFPAGVLTSTGQYYVAFYDSTAATPAWQTIAGPLSADPGLLSLTITGNVGSTTLQQNDLYGFAIFTVASGSTSTPPPAPSTYAYITNSKNGTVVVDANGNTPFPTLAINAESIGLDDSGKIYANYVQPAPSPAASGSPQPSPLPAIVTSYAANSATVLKTYTPSNPFGIFVGTSGAGAFTVFGGATADNDQMTMETFDVWNAGASSAPSFSFTEPINYVYFGLMGHDGSIYAPHVNTNGTFQYDVYGPGSATPTRTINETIVPAGQQQYFTPNYATVGADGTLYVTEYSFDQPDPLAGLYIYPPNGGAEKFVATASNANGNGPQGVDVDASGNIYVANNNSAYYCNATPDTQPCQGDSLANIQVFAPGGGSLLRTIPSTPSVFPLSVSAGGTIFVSAFQAFSAFPVTEGTYSVAAGGSTVKQVSTVASSGLVLYDGSRETTGTRRAPAAAHMSASAGQAFGGPASHRPFFAKRMAAMMHR